MNSKTQFTDKLKNNLTGQTFARLTVIGYEGQNKHTSHMWRCRCECGNEKIVKASNLRNGHTKSCGCIPTGKIKHGHSWEGGCSPEYKTWKNMRRRCSDPKTSGYEYYGGRGISVCNEWEESFEAFLRDMGPRPSEKHSLDRRDTNGNYNSENCRWATREEQDNNRRDNIFATIDGKRQTISQWIRELDLSGKAVFGRLWHGWTPEDALTTPIKEAHKPIYATLNGKTKRLSEWIKDLGLSEHGPVIYARVRSGWTPERALETNRDCRWRE